MQTISINNNESTIRLMRINNQSHKSYRTENSKITIASHPIQNGASVGLQDVEPGRPEE